MLDVHLPHHPVHAWRDFFVHIATISVGLLIAIALEQTVEAIHHHHQLAELREGILRDGEKATLDATHIEATETINLQWQRQRLAQVTAATAQHQPLPDLPMPQVQPYDYPADPTWKAAKSAGLLALVPQDEVKAYSESDDIVNNVYGFWHDRILAFDNRQALEAQFGSATKTSAKIAALAPADLVEYQRLLREEISATTRLLNEVRYLRGAETAILHGARSLDEIQNSEKEFVLQSGH